MLTSELARVTELLDVFVAELRYSARKQRRGKRPKALQNGNFFFGLKWIL